MIQLALRSSIQAEVPSASTRSARIDGSATAVIISSRPGEEDPGPEHREQRVRRTAVHGGSVGGWTRPGPHSGATSKVSCSSAAGRLGGRGPVRWRCGSLGGTGSRPRRWWARGNSYFAGQGKGGCWFAKTVSDRVAPQAAHRPVQPSGLPRVGALARSGGEQHGRGAPDARGSPGVVAVRVLRRGADGLSSRASSSRSHPVDALPGSGARVLARPCQFYPRRAQPAPRAPPGVVPRHPSGHQVHRATGSARPPYRRSGRVAAACPGHADAPMAARHPDRPERA